MCDWCFACKITMVLILLSNHGCHEDVWKLMFCSGLCATFSPVERCVLFWTCWWGRLQEVIEFEDYWCKLRLIIDMKEFKCIGTVGILQYRDIKKMSRMYQREKGGDSERDARSFSTMILSYRHRGVFADIRLPVVFVTWFLSLFLALCRLWCDCFYIAKWCDLWLFCVQPMRYGI